MKSFIRILVNIEDESALATILENGCAAKNYNISALETTESVADACYAITKD